MNATLRDFINEVISGMMRGGRRMEAPGNLRYGEQVVSPDSDSLDADLEDESEKERADRLAAFDFDSTVG